MRKIKYAEVLKEEQATFDSVIKDLDDSIEGCINFSDPKYFERHAECITTYDKDMKNSLVKATDYNEQEGLFGLPSTN